MRTFTKGVLVGIGVGLLFAPMKGEEMRRMLNERVTELRNSLPENTNQYISQVSDRVSQASENLRTYAQQAASKVKDTGNTLGDLVQRSAREVKQTGQDLADTTRQTVNTTKAGGSTTRVIPETGTSS
jgi:gas vesicle protein